MTPSRDTSIKKILKVLLYLSIMSNSLLAFEKVEYLADSIIQKDGNYIMGTSKNSS